ncbi:hemerythrin family protein [Pseudanabaena sp. FACHB-2040]|uniref:bacteriohemerythrin n=1 Tax=Pseudanabaena sp. FACHB-2040 TaxID=2692859 RepID=UPI0016870E02|nr:hemerythrin family protein [Pseudanabaena sp. FACHB-2040]MBD2258342.1 hemerythrin family protein [Pseudanabaena sp. FACHB-2040]
MQKFEWTDSLSVGVPMIDTQHKELIAAFNDLSDAIEQGTGSTSIKKLLVFLQYFTEWHFGQEESCAAKHKCPIAGTNQQAHAKFLEIFGELKTRYRESGASEEIARQVHTQLADWLVSHIMTIDTQLGQCIRHRSTSVA